ncbi:MAG: 6-carboxytetrahydropterin synthase [Phycisphaerae bacterium]|nr:6-carboxytetrahydropterin synthase [Phycisphaerae bacterium]
MYTITIESSFTASHRLTYAGGVTEENHKHDWQLKVAAQIEELDENGLAVDFIYLKAKIDEVTAVLDNTQLEELECFQRINATAENLVKYIYDQIEPQMPTKAMLDSVEIMEAPGCWAKYNK